MGRKPKNPPQNFEQMATEMQTARRNRSPESRLYSRTESLQAVNDALTDVVSKAAAEFGAFQRMDGKINLRDTEAVERIMTEYLSACGSTACIPKVTGLARALGYTYEGMRLWKLSHPEHATTRMLDAFRDLCADVLRETGLRGITQVIGTVFLLKADYGLRDALTIETAQPQQPLAAPEDPEAIAEKYALLLDDFQETN